MRNLALAPELLLEKPEEEGTALGAFQLDRLAPSLASEEGGHRVLLALAAHEADEVVQWQEDQCLTAFERQEPSASDIDAAE